MRSQQFSAPNPHPRPPPIGQPPILQQFSNHKKDLQSPEQIKG